MEVISAEVAERGCDVLKPKRGDGIHQASTASTGFTTAELACSRLQPRESLPELPRRRPSAPLWAIYVSRFFACERRRGGGAALTTLLHTVY